MTDDQAPPAAAPKERAGGKVVLSLLAGLVLLGALAYVAAYLASGDRVPRGTTVSGVHVGGLTEDDAAARLREGLADRTDRPIVVRAGDREQEVDPGAAGLAVDYDASVADAGASRSWDPAWLWAYFTGGDKLEADVVVDETALDETLADLDSELGTEAVDGRVRFNGTRVRVRDAVQGERLDRDAAREALVTAFLAQDATAEVPLLPEPPEIDAADVRAAVDGFANPAVSGPVTLTFGDSDVRLEPRRFVKALSMEPDDGSLKPVLDSKRLAGLVEAGVVADGGEPVDATVRLVGGTPQVVPGKPGVTYDQPDVDAAFLDAVVKPEGKRTAEVKAKVVDPEFTTKDARKLGIKEKVSTFTTYFPYAEYRNTNIGRAGELINGTVLKPGEVFSLNGIVGERTEANGFVPGFIISNGIFKEDLGGGVSQMATTTFNAAFFAGLKDIEHKPHSFYIDRYPVGREATVAWGAVDLRFENDTPYGVLVQANVSPSTPSSSGVVTVSMWSTKYWDITTRTGNRYNFTSPATRTLDTEDCYPNTGYGGFDIDVWRYFRKAGSSTLERTEKLHTTYIPSDTVICTDPDAG